MPRPPFLLIILLAASWLLPTDVEAQAPAVTVVTSARATVIETLPITGTVVAREEVLVSPQIDGLAIVEIRVEEGDKVTAGEVLARLSRDILDASLAQNAAQIARAEASLGQARAQIAEAQATHAQADAAFARTRQLIGSGAASRETFDQRQMEAQTATARQQTSEAALSAAQADLALVQAQRQELMVRLARTDIRSPVAGRVSRRTARLGAVVGSANDPLFRIIQDDAVELEADVPEALLARLLAGQRAQVVLAGEAASRPGTVRLVAPEVNRASRLGRIRVTIDGTAVVGGFGRAVVETGRRDGVVVPLSAVQSQVDGDRVQVVRDGVVQTRKVSLGLRDTTRVEVDEGLAAGEAVIAVSGTFVRDGDRVTVVGAP